MNALEKYVILDLFTFEIEQIENNQNCIFQYFHILFGSSKYFAKKLL